MPVLFHVFQKHVFNPFLAVFYTESVWNADAEHVSNEPKNGTNDPKNKLIFKTIKIY